MEPMTTTWKEQLLLEAAAELRKGTEKECRETMLKLARLLVSLEESGTLSELLLCEEQALVSRITGRYGLSDETASVLQMAGMPTREVHAAAVGRASQELIQLIRERPAPDAWNVFH